WLRFGEIMRGSLSTWLLPYSLNGESLQNKYIRVRIISDKGNAKGNTATSDAN
ncbi:TPA: hypothetical protein ACIHXR_005233, partial [Salmonella enterica subsp. enterica serovar Typhimurium]